MKLSVRSSILYTATFAGLLMLSACGKKEDQAATSPAGSTTAAAPASTAPVPATPAPATTSAMAPATAPTAAPAAAPAAPAPAADTLKVSSVALGSAVGADKKVSKAKNAFAPNEKTIYASVATDGSSAGATLNAKWTFQDGDTVSTVSDISQSIATDGPAVTTFKIQNPNEWPEGKYKVVISLNGQSVGDQSFEVKKR